MTDFPEGLIITTGDTCKGLVFKCIVSSYIDKNGIYINTTKMVLLKRKSCDDCESCDCLLNEFYEYIEEGLIPDHDKYIEDKALYMLSCEVTNVDFETGYADDWDYVFVKIEE